MLKNIIQKILSNDKRTLAFMAIVVLIFSTIVAFVVRSSIINANEISFENYNYQTEQIADIFDHYLDLTSSHSRVWAEERDILRLLQGETEISEALNRELVRYAERTGLSAIYLLDEDGLCIASSEETFLNENYGFRPYFISAIQGDLGLYLAVGVTSGQLGVYQSSPVVIDDEIRGVVVSKISGEDMKTQLQYSQTSSEDIIALASGSFWFSNTTYDGIYSFEVPSVEEVALVKEYNRLNLEEVTKLEFEATSYSMAKNERIYDIDGKLYVFSSAQIPGINYEINRLLPYDIVVAPTEMVKTHLYWLTTGSIVAVLGFAIVFYIFAKYFREQYEVRDRLASIEMSFKNTIELLPIGVLRTKIDGSISYVNKEGLRIIGFDTLAEAKKANVLNIYSNREDREEILRRLNKEKSIRNYDVEIIRFDDKERRLVVYDGQLLEDNSSIEMFIRDVTSERISEERLTAAAESTGDWIWELDRDGVYTYCSEKVFKILGYTADEVIGKTPFDFMTEEEKNRLSPVIEKLFRKKEPIVALQNENISKDGSIVILETNGVPFTDNRGNLLGYRGTDSDITERVERQEELLLLTNAIDQSATTVVITDIDGNISYVNPHFEELTGYTKEEVIGQNPKVLKSGYHSQEFYKNLWDTILSGEVFKGQIKNKTKDGQFFWEDTTITPIKDEDGNITHFMAIKEDVTGRKELEEERELYEMITTGIADELYMIDVDENITFVNAKVTENLGYKEEELVDANISKIDPNYIKDLWKERLEQLQETSETPMIETLFKTKNGEDRIKELTIQHVEYKGRPQILAIGRDVTKRKAEEEREQEYLEEIEKVNEIMSRREYKIVEQEDELEKLKEQLSKFKKYFGDKE